MADERRWVINFVPENLNGILSWLARHYNKALEDFGYRTITLFTHHPDWNKELEKWASKKNLVFAYGHQGIGSNVNISHDGGTNLWKHLRLPFLSLHGDNPCYNPANHRNNWQGTVNVYWSHDFWIAQRRLVQAPQLALVEPIMGYPVNPRATRLSWEKRPIRYLFVKTGPGRKEFSHLAEQLPSFLHKAFYCCCQEGERNTTLALTDLVEKVLEAHGIVLPNNKAVLRFAYLVDLHVRGWRANTLVEQVLAHHPVMLVGSGWDHMDFSHAAIYRHTNLDAQGLEDLYAQSQFIFNLSPNYCHGTHERVIAALMANAACVTDDNRSMSEDFAFPNLFTYRWNEPDLAAQIFDVIANKDCSQEVDGVRCQLEERHDLHLFWQRMSPLLNYALSV